LAFPRIGHSFWKPNPLHGSITDKSSGFFSSLLGEIRCLSSVFVLFTRTLE
jgi:hypothetical protein